MRWGWLVYYASKVKLEIFGGPHSMTYPDLLRPSGTESILLGDKRKINIPKTTPRFKRWEGYPVSDSYGGKIILKYYDEPLFAELLILRHFEKAGWQGAWIDTYRNRYLKSFTKSVSLPPEQHSTLNDVFKKAGSRHGCFDVFAWKGSVVIFAEAKRARNDHIRDSQKRWLSAAINIGLPLDSFLIVEWNLS